MPVPEHVDLIQKEALRLGFPLSTEVATRLSLFYDLLAKWNPRVRLVGNVDFREFVWAHLPDALMLARLISNRLKHDEEADVFPFLDVGSGAGLPGFLMALLLPNRHICLCDHSEKKISFLHEAERRLKGGVEIFHCSAETLIDKGLSFPHVVSRAVFKPPVWQTIGAALCKPGGRVWCMWTVRQEREVAHIRVEERHPYTLVDGRKRLITGFTVPAGEE